MTVGLPRICRLSSRLSPTVVPFWVGTRLVPCSVVGMAAVVLLSLSLSLWE